MGLLGKGVRLPVKREGAEKYLLLSLVSFAGSVIATRVFLELTGYPQIGNSELHIAHVLWGGLALFVASLLPLLFSNRWALSAAAILSGVGVGLFIDEVGKFITQNNDYFYQPAAPIIYAFFLLTVLIYLRVRKPPSRDPRSELYRILDSMTEVLDHDLDPIEHSILKARLLELVAKTENADLNRLSTSLLAYVSSDTLRTVEPDPPFFHKIQSRLKAIERKLIGRRRHRAILILGLAGLGFITLFKLAAFLIMLPQGLSNAIEGMITAVLSQGQLHSSSEATWFFVRVILEGVVGFTGVISAFLIAIGQEKRGLVMGILSQVLSLTAVNLLVFYLDQFGALFFTLLQFLLLMSLVLYRRRYLPVDDE